MKGPFERLKYDMRRIWECPECHHKERTDGKITTVLCRCQGKKEPLDRVVMKLVEDQIQRRFPEFVPPTVEEYGVVETGTDEATVDGNAPAEVAVSTDSDFDKATLADEPPTEEASND